MTLDAALKRFDFTLALLQTEAAVARVAAEMCEDAAAEGVTTLEIRFAPSSTAARAPRPSSTPRSPGSPGAPA